MLKKQTQGLIFHMKVPEQYRITEGPFASDSSQGNNGAFVIPFESYKLFVIASDGQEWEHVSVSLPSRCPNWKEMCYIKSLFWDDSQCVIQYHPPKKEYINNHVYCLHLWRPLKRRIPRPPKELVGLPEFNKVPVFK